MSRLPNPERQWERELELQSIERVEVTERIGPSDEPLAVLSGGLANLNVRVGRDHVLRIYRRDPAVLRKEAWLLSQNWQSFRVPKVERIGDDFLVLEFVDAHQDQVAEQGAAVGRALVEIHLRGYEHAGFLDSNGQISEPMPEFMASAREYIESLGSERHADVYKRVLGAWRDHEPQLLALCEPAVLLHGDLKASNLHWTDSGELLVLDWEFAYAGPALLDVGQLVRWDPPAHFEDEFAEAYSASGRELPKDWKRWAAAFDLINLVSLLEGSAAGSRRQADVLRKIGSTLESLKIRA